MALSKKKNRDRMRITRATEVQPKVVQPTGTIPGLIMEGNKILGVKPGTLKSTTSPVKEESNTKLPIYNPRIHKTGDRVRMRGLKGWEEVTVPDLDGEGNLVPLM